MSGIIGHLTYAILTGKAMAARKTPVSAIIGRHFSAYLAGAYLGCDIGTLPAAICVQTGAEVGYGPIALEKSPITGGPVKAYSITIDGQTFTPRQINTMFYGRSHLVFGWNQRDRKQTLPWDHLADYASLVFADAVELFAPGQRQLAYAFGWLSHIVGDALIKSIRPGVSLHLLDGKYTPKNRPIQDLVSFHEIGRKELHLDWAGLMEDLVYTPVEPLQAHYMRLAPRRGQLGRDFSTAWEPRYQKLITKVMAENRRYQRIRNPRLIKQLALRRTPTGLDCDPELKAKTGGLTYQQMVNLADRAGFRNALLQIATATADLFDDIVRRQPTLSALPNTDAPTWKEITAKWRR